MTNLERKVKVTSRTIGSLSYQIDPSKPMRTWNKAGDYLNITIAELLELRTIGGGEYTLREYLLIEDEEALKLVFDEQDVEPEYKYGIAEVDFLLYESELEQFLDALDYAPKGVLDLILVKAKEKLPNTTAKISAINDKFSVDINKSFDLLKKDGSEEEEKESATPARRAAPIKTETKAKAPQYKVVKEGK